MACLGKSNPAESQGQLQARSWFWQSHRDNVATNNPGKAQPNRVQHVNRALRFIHVGINWPSPSRKLSRAHLGDTRHSLTSADLNLGEISDDMETIGDYSITW